jgi:hypothetical protein
MATTVTTCVRPKEEPRLKTFTLRVQESQEAVLAELESAQSISGSSVDSRKLNEFLRVKFGAGAYNIHVSRATEPPLSDFADRATLGGSKFVLHSRS